VSRENNKRKKVIESDQTSLLINQASKGFRAPGLLPKKRRAPGLQDGIFGAVRVPSLHSKVLFGQNQYF